MSVVNRVLQFIKNRREKAVSGLVNCIPIPFERFREEWPGIEQEKYYLISGGTKSAKTQLMNELFLYNSVLYAYYNPSEVRVKFFYYPLEETPDKIILRFMSHLLYILSGNKIIISPTNLSSTNKDKILDEDIIKLLESEEYLDILNFFESVVEFKTSRNPTGVWKDVKQYAEENGTSYYNNIDIKNEKNEIETVKQFSYYVPNDLDEYVFIIIDHISLLDTERGLNLKQTIDKLSEYLIIFRNRYKYIPVVVQQQNIETIGLDAFKLNKIRPTKAGLADSKTTGNDCNMMLGITSPYAYELPAYQGYDITKFKNHIRFMETVLNRDGESNSLCPLYFNGATNYFSELPRPDNSKELEIFYELCKPKIKEKTNKLFLIFKLKK